VSSEAARVKESPPQCLATASEVPRGHKRTDLGVIPEGWRPCSVGRLGEVLIGKALAVHAPGQLRPYLRTKNVFDGRIDIGDVLTMPMTDAQFEHFRLHPGDVLLNEGQSLELVGRCAIYRHEFPEPCAIQNQLLRFRARAGVSPEFAAHLFRYCQQTGIFARIALQTTSIAHLGGSRFASLLLAWPERETEQRAIAEALSDADGLLGALEALIAKKRDIKQAAMQQLLTGRTRLPGFAGQWERKPLGDLAEVKTGPFGSALHERDYVSDGTPIITVEHLGERGVVHANLPRVSDGDRTRLNTYSLVVGDIVFSRVGSIDRNALIRPAEEGWLFSGRLLRVRPDNTRVSSAYLSHHFHGQDFKARVREVAVGQTMASLNTRILQGVEVFFPGLPEQTAIATVLSDMDAEIAALEQLRDKARAIKQGMMQQLLTGRVRLVMPETTKQAAC
jgi:type I restriction enzyme S subunit